MIQKNMFNQKFIQYATVDTYLIFSFLYQIFRVHINLRRI